MGRPSKLESAAVDAWLVGQVGWTRTQAGGIAKVFPFADFASALAFVVRVGCLAERRDHHPDVELGWGRARIGWSTHDAGGVTSLDLEAAEATDTLSATGISAG
jgi:4a-hydroxytetrahydrobiopterin dehydratase